jgi:hypothetical protein
MFPEDYKIASVSLLSCIYPYFGLTDFKTKVAHSSCFFNILNDVESKYTFKIDWIPNPEEYSYKYIPDMSKFSKNFIVEINNIKTIDSTTYTLQLYSQNSRKFSIKNNLTKITINEVIYNENLDKEIINKIENNIYPSNGFDLNSDGNTFDFHTVYETDPHIEDIEGIRVQLRTHQSLSIYRMRNMEDSDIIEYSEEDREYEDSENVINCKTNLGFLSDIPGSGKSLMILACISNKPILLPKDEHNIQIHGKKFFYTVKSIPSKYNHVNSNLILVEHSIIDQWELYLQTQTSLSYKIIKDNKDFPKDRKEYKSFFESKKVFVISSKFFYKLNGYINNLLFSRFIIDEAHKTELELVTKCLLPNAVFYWLITASINDIFNIKITGVSCSSAKNSTYLHHNHPTMMLIQDIPFSLKSIQKMLIVKNDQKFVESSLGLKEYTTVTLISRDTHIINVVNGIVSNDIMMMINAGDIQNAISSLNIEETTEEHILTALTIKLNNEYHNLELDMDRAQKYNYSTKAAKDDAIEKIQKSMDELSNKIKLLEDRIKSTDMCTICYDDTFTQKTFVKCCNQAFCFGCITAWLSLNNKCPYCKFQLSSAELIAVTQNTKNTKVDTQVIKTKKEHIDDIVANGNPTDKYLIFSEHDGTFREINQVFQKNKVELVKINNLTKFKNSNVPIALFLNAKHNGAGLNLTEVTKIIIYHKVTNTLRSQIIGRGFRHGRQADLDLTIYDVLYENETHIKC